MDFKLEVILGLISIAVGIFNLNGNLLGVSLILIGLSLAK